MSSILDELKKYFETTDIKTALKEWENSAFFDSVGPTVEEYLNYSLKNYIILNPIINWEFKTKNLNYSPEFSSGFLLKKINYQYAKSYFFNNKLSIR